MPQEKVHAPMACTVVEVPVQPGQRVRAGQTLIVVEAMKMEHEIRAEADARVLQVGARAGELVAEGDLLMRLGPAPVGADGDATPQAPVANASPAPGMRADLQEVLMRHALTLDAQRPEAVAKRHALGLRTAREKPRRPVRRRLVHRIRRARRRRPAHATQRGRPDRQHAGRRHGHRHRQRQRRAVRRPEGWRTEDALRRDGLRRDRARRHAGHAQPPEDRPPAGAWPWHQKLPVVLFAEGGGGRPGDVDIAQGGRPECVHLRQFCANSTARCRWLASSKGAALPAMPPCWVAADVIIATRAQQHRHGRAGHGRGRWPGRVQARADWPQQRCNMPGMA